MHALLFPCSTNLIDVLALEFFEEFGETVVISIDTDRLQNTLDIGFGGALVASKAKEEVGCEVLHFEM